jgi:hypothetical protein
MIMFVGVLSLIVNVFLVTVTWRLVRNTKDTVQHQLRAYVSVSVESHPDTQSNQPLTAILILKNSGLTPAYVVSVWARMGLRPYPGEDKDFERLSIIYAHGRFIFDPREKYRISPEEDKITLTDQDRTGIVEGGDGLYVWGEITYEDAFKCKWLRKFRLIIAGKHMASGSELRWCEFGNKESQV